MIPDATSSTFTLNNVKFEASGIYACEVTNTLVKELAIHSRPVNLIVTAATPVEEINETHIRIYPNPVKDVLHFDGIQGQSAADIYNAEGKFITNTIIRDNQIRYKFTFSRNIHCKNTGSIRYENRQSSSSHDMKRPRLNAFIYFSKS